MLGHSQDSLLCFIGLFARFFTSTILLLSFIAIQFIFILEETHYSPKKFLALSQTMGCCCFFFPSGWTWGKISIYFSFPLFIISDFSLFLLPFNNHSFLLLYLELIFFKVVFNSYISSQMTFSSCLSISLNFSMS